MPYIVEMTVTNNNLPLLSMLEPLMKARLLLALEQIGVLLERGAVLAIQNQVAPDGESWAALSEWYVSWKKRKGYSEQIYLMSSSYLQAITSKVLEEEMTVIAGVMRDAGYGAKGVDAQIIEIYRVAEILEYGWEQFNVRIHPRPLWRPLLQVNEHGIQTRVGIAISSSARIIAALAKGSVD